uniref:Uncharacterized protein n=1 Tax=Parascaris equorum TaxID=6256 RepID=A0A914SGX5_PAREQ
MNNRAMFSDVKFVLNRLAEELESLLTCAYHTPIPGPGETLMIESGLGCNKLELNVPNCDRLPTLREDKFMLEFYNANALMRLLKERRIIFTGRKLSQLSSSKKAAKQLDLGEIVVIDVDEHTLQSSHNDVSDLPAEAVNFLRHQTNVFLFGGYRLGLCHSSTSITWDREKFVSSQRASLQPFLRPLIGQDGVQYLERVRLPIDDEFEKEARLMDNKPPRTSQLVSSFLAILNT